MSEGKLRARSPLISVITATRNAARVLPKAIEAMREQTYENFEWIIVDGASTDETVDLIRANEGVIDRWISEPDRGIYDAWNKGLHVSRGHWICFLGADDWFWEPDVIAKMAQVLKHAYPPFRVVYGKVASVNAAGEVLSLAGEPWQNVRQRFQSVMALPHTGLMHHRSLFQKHGPFDTSFRIAGDYELLLRELRFGQALFAPGIITAGMMRYGVSSTPELLGVNLREFRRASRKNGRFFPGMPWVIAAVRHNIRILVWLALGEDVARSVLDCGRRVLGKPAYWTKTRRIH